MDIKNETIMEILDSEKKIHKFRLWFDGWYTDDDSTKEKVDILLIPGKPNEMKAEVSIGDKVTVKGDIVLLGYDKYFIRMLFDCIKDSYLTKVHAENGCVFERIGNDWVTPKGIKGFIKLKYDQQDGAWIVIFESYKPVAEFKKLMIILYVNGFESTKDSEFEKKYGIQDSDI